MSEKIVQLNEEIIKGQLKELVRGSVEETLNELLEKEAESLTQAARYERSEARQGYRSGHYDRSLTTTSGDVTLHVPRLKGVSFETAIIERYRRRESSVEEALIEMYLAGVSVRRVEDITEALWGSKVSPTTISELNKKAYVHIEDWRNRPLQGGRYPYVYVDGIYLRRNWGGEYENVAVLVAIAVNEDGFREVLGAAEGMKEDKASWVSFFQWLRGRGLDGVKLIVGDKCMGMLEAVGEVFPDAKYQRCTVHFYRNVFSVVPKSKVKIMVKMLKAIHAQESKKSAREKAKAVVEQLRSMKLKEAAKTDPKAAEEWQALKEKEAVARQRKKEREEERMAADPEYAAMMAERKAEYTRTRTAKRQAEREALVELAKTDEEAAKKLAEMRKYQSQATVRSYQKMKADAEAGDPDAIKRYETTLAKRREEYHRKKGA